MGLKTNWTYIAIVKKEKAVLLVCENNMIKTVYNDFENYSASQNSIEILRMLKLIKVTELSENKNNNYRLKGMKIFTNNLVIAEKFEDNNYLEQYKKYTQNTTDEFQINMKKLINEVESKRIKINYLPTQFINRMIGE